MTRSSHLVRRVRTLLFVSILLAWAAAAESWLDPIRGLDDRGRTREALSRLEAEPARLAADAEARLLQGVLLAKLGRTAEARELYQRLILDRPDLPEAYNNLAVMHAAAGDYEAAIEILKQGLATHQSYRTTYDNLTKVYGKLAGEAYSKALGDERIDAEPLRLALINSLAPSRGAPPVEPPQPPTVDPPAESPIVAAPVAPPPAPTATGSETPPPPGGQPEEPESEIWRTVQSWADAWASQRADLYLSFYGAAFVPPAGSTRLEWEEHRRRRLAAPGHVRISLALLEIQRPAPDRAIVRFVQSYESDLYRDTVTKALELRKTGPEWRIAAERVEGESAG